MTAHIFKWRYNKLVVLSSAFIYLLVFNFSLSVASTIEHKNVKSIKTFEQKLKEYTAKNMGKVLLVYDIDDTLLESSSFFGGDSWYIWQDRQPIIYEDGNKIIISDNDILTCKYKKLGVFYDLGNFYPVESDTVDVFNRLQKQFDTIILTSRSPDYRSGTQRVLNDAKFEFAKTSLLPKDFALYYDFHDGNRQRDVSYANGVVMSTGLNKGLVLKDLLQTINRQYSAIFFIDDSQTNVTNMELAWQEDTTEVHIFHYTHVKKVISQIDIVQSQNAKKSFNEFLKVAFPIRSSEFSQNKCGS